METPMAQTVSLKLMQYLIVVMLAPHRQAEVRLTRNRQYISASLLINHLLLQR